MLEKDKKQAVMVKAKVLKNLEAAPHVFHLVIEAGEMAGLIKPGQFAQLKIETGGMDPLLPRPISFFDWNKDKGTVEFLFHRIGRGTSLLSRLAPGDCVDLWGPLGQGWQTELNSSLSPVMVAGGIGIAPLLGLAKYYTSKGVASKLLAGARCSDGLLYLDMFQHMGVIVQQATEDGSAGLQGRVTGLLEQMEHDDICNSALFVCGPKPMMASVAKWSMEQAIPCQVSLEEHMACGVGACLACVCKIKSSAVESGGWTHRKTCTDGPVFKAEEVFWT